MNEGITIKMQKCYNNYSFYGGTKMEKWFGAAGICINDNAELLMVLQGKPEEVKTWSIPSGGLEQGESFAQCCIREIEEETGYLVEILEELNVKEGTYNDLGISFEVHYFLVTIIGGQRNIQDPDKLIYEIAWKTEEELEQLELTYPEDRSILIGHIQNCKNNHNSVKDSHDSAIY